MRRHWHSIGGTYGLAQDHYGDVQNEEIGDDHEEDPADLAFVPHNKMESRVEHQGLSSHHTPPTDADEHADKMSVLPDAEVKQQEAEGMDGAAPRGKQQTPEVEATISLEAQPDS